MNRLARGLLAFAVAVPVLAAATGWLYLVRPRVSVPGPVVHDALALDELSRHGGVPLLLYTAVWLAAALCLGLIARWARADRVTAGLLLALGVGGWLYALNGVSILVVRQIPAHQAFHDAAAEQALAIPAVLAGVVGAVVGRSTTAGAARSRVIFAW